MNLSCGMLKTAIAGGCATPEALARRTGASTLCGSCLPLLAALTGREPVAARQRGRPVLVASAVVTMLAVALVVLAAPVRYPQSVQTTVAWDAIWRDSFWRQATGFTLVGVSFLGLVMSLRKRSRWFRWGDFGLWRALHAVLGVSGLAVLAAHTGMRFGDNLNSILMTAFVGTNIFGALAGGVTGVNAAWPLLSRWLTWAHIAFVWLLPVLVAFHIWSAYFF